MSPWAVANLGVGLLQAEQMCKSLPREAPWEAKKAAEWDRISIAEWLEKSVMSKAASEMLDTALAGPYTTAASETSLLWMLLQQGSAGGPTIGGPTFVISGKGGAQDARPVGGMGAIYRPMVAELGDALHLSQPVRHIAQDAEGVTIRSDDVTLRAHRAIVAIPLAIANTISYEPVLPVDRALLHQRMPGTRHRVCWPSSATHCVPRVVASIGPAPKVRPPCAGGSTARFAPENAPRPK